MTVTAYVLRTDGSKLLLAAQDLADVYEHFIRSDSYATAFVPASGEIWDKTGAEETAPIWVPELPESLTTGINLGELRRAFASGVQS